VLWNSHFIKEKFPLRVVTHTKHVGRLSFAHAFGIQRDNDEHPVGQRFCPLDLNVQAAVGGGGRRRDPGRFLPGDNP